MFMFVTYFAGGVTRFATIVCVAYVILLAAIHIVGQILLAMHVKTVDISAKKKNWSLTSSSNYNAQKICLCFVTWSTNE